MLNGTLKLNMDSNRLEVVDGENRYELRCGDQLEVFASGQWERTRAEIDVNGQWYLVGLRECLGLSARI